MPTALPIPDDVLTLAKATRAAELAMEAAARAAEGLDEARRAYIEAAEALRAHPIWERARAGACHAQTWQAAKDAAKILP